MRLAGRIGSKILISSLACWPAAIWADEAGAPIDPAANHQPSSADGSDQRDDSWQFRLAVPLYIWWPDWNASLGADNLQVDLDLTHHDVISLVSDDLQGIFTFLGEARRGRWAAELDLFLIRLEGVGLADLDLGSGRFRTDLDMEFRQRMAHFNLSYRLFEKQLSKGPFRDFYVEPIVAFRYLSLEANAEIKDSPISSLNGREVLDERERYFQLLPLGVQMEVGLSERWSIFTRAMFGGWGIWDSKDGADYLIDVVLKYRFSESWTAQLGLRWFDMDVEGDDFDYEVSNVVGPAFGVIWSF
jgi:hypothetical protein